MKRRKKKYTSKVSAGITGETRKKLRALRRERHTSYAELVRQAIDKVYAS